MGTADSTRVLVTTLPILKTASLTKLATSLVLPAGADLMRILMLPTPSRNIPPMASPLLRTLRALPLQLHQKPLIESRQHRRMEIIALLLLVPPNVPKVMVEAYPSVATL